MEEDIAILVWGHNYMHNDAAVHKDEWEEFFQHYYRLQRGNYWKSEGKAVDWKKYINALVQSLLVYSSAYAYAYSSAYVYTPLF